MTNEMNYSYGSDDANLVFVTCAEWEAQQARLAELEADREKNRWMLQVVDAARRENFATKGEALSQAILDLRALFKAEKEGKIYFVIEKYLERKP